MKRKQKGILAVILILLVGIGIYAYEQHEAAVKKAAAQTLTLSGNVDVREVTLSFRESDRIKEILVEEGDTVEEGQVLARLDTDELNINLRKTKAQIAAQEQHDLVACGLLHLVDARAEELPLQFVCQCPQADRVKRHRSPPSSG